MSHVSPCRTYIVYRHGLFARGIRSMLEERPIVQIVGMESDADAALKAVRSIKPDVIILEEAIPKRESDRLAIFLQGAAEGRVVRLSLEDDQAIVYNRSQAPAGNAADLVKAIRGAAKLRRSAAPDRQPVTVQSETPIAHTAKSQTPVTSKNQPSARPARKPEGRAGRARKRQ
jgi:DNA-binding NarL/FixJ family response regulator